MWFKIKRFYLWILWKLDLHPGSGMICPTCGTFIFMPNLAKGMRCYKCGESFAICLSGEEK